MIKPADNGNPNTLYVRQVYGPMLEALERRQEERASQGLAFHEMPNLAPLSSVELESEHARQMASMEQTPSTVFSPVAPQPSNNPVVNRIRGEVHNILTEHKQHAAEVMRRKRELENMDPPAFAEADVKMDFVVNNALFGALSNLSQIEMLTEDVDMAVKEIDQEHPELVGLEKHERVAAEIEATVYANIDEPDGLDDNRPSTLVSTLKCEDVISKLSDLNAEKVEQIEAQFAFMYSNLIDSGLAGEDPMEFLRRQSLMKNTAMLAIVDIILSFRKDDAEFLSVQAELIALVGTYTWEQYRAQYGEKVRPKPGAARAK
eukprot:PhF_6_TR26245/c1_g1_i2/m.37526